MRSCCWCGRLRDVEILSTSGAEGGVKFDLHTLLQAVEGLCVVRITFNSYVVVLEPELGEGPAAPAVGGGGAGNTRPATFFWYWRLMAFHSRWASAIRGSWICSLRAGSQCDESSVRLKPPTVPAST